MSSTTPSGSTATAMQGGSGPTLAVSGAGATTTKCKQRRSTGVHSTAFVRHRDYNDSFGKVLRDIGRGPNWIFAHNSGHFHRLHPFGNLTPPYPTIYLSAQATSQLVHH